MQNVQYHIDFAICLGKLYNYRVNDIEIFDTHIHSK